MRADGLIGWSRRSRPPLQGRLRASHEGRLAGTGRALPQRWPMEAGSFSTSVVKI